MPIKPENRHHYKGAAWRTIRETILSRAGNRCEGTPARPDCRADNHQPHPETGSIVVLTIAHMDQNPANNAHDNLRALCQKCHNGWDAPHRARNRGQAVSQYKVVRGVKMKSCPSCGKFQPLADFGERQIEPGKFIPQSWCPTCRSSKEAAHA